MAETLWHQTAPRVTPLTMLEGSTEAGVAIIGGGYTGLSCALHLARAGQKTVVLEARTPGWGASGRNAGQWLPGLAGRSPQSVVDQLGQERGRNLNRFSLDAVRLVTELVAACNIDADVNRSGVLVVAHTAKKFQELQEIHESWFDLGARTTFVSPQELGAYLTTTRYFGGLLYEDAGTLNPLAYARGLATAAQEAGAAVHENSQATEVSRHRDRWRIVTPAGEVVAERLAVCTNAYTNGLWPDLARSFYRLPMTMLASAVLPDRGRGFMPGGIPFADTNTLSLFGGMQDPQGRFVASVLPQLSDHGSIHAASRSFDAKFRRVFKGQEPPRWEHRWTGNLCVVPDRIPRLYRLGAGAISAMGYSGAGIAMGTALGRELARCLANDDLEDAAVPVVAPKALRLTRTLPLLFRFVAAPVARGLDKAY